MCIRDSPKPDRIGPAAAGVPNPWTGPTPATPATNPYLPTADTGAVRFTTANPTYDGRGITCLLYTSRCV